MSDYYSVSKDAIQLSQSQSANPDECGSCKFFKRYSNGDPGYNVGHCSFKLPRQVKLQDYDPDQESPTTVSDTFGCSLYQPTGHKYAKLKYWIVR